MIYNVLAQFSLKTIERLIDILHQKKKQKQKLPKLSFWTIAEIKEKTNAGWLPRDLNYLVECVPCCCCCCCCCCNCCCKINCCCWMCCICCKSSGLACIMTCIESCCCCSGGRDWKLSCSCWSCCRVCICICLLVSGEVRWEEVKRDSEDG